MDRRSKLREIIKSRFGGSQADFAAAIKRSPAQVSQWLSGYRAIGDAGARVIEMALDLPRGHFDTTGAQDLLPPPKTARVLPFPDPPEIAAPTIAALLARFRDELEELPDPLRKAVADLVSDYLKTPDPETGQTVASAIERLIDRKTPP